MNNGVLCFANNNGRIDYVKQAEFLATRVKKYLGLPTSLVTSTPQDVSNKKLFDNIIEIQDKNKNITIFIYMVCLMDFKTKHNLFTIHL